MKKLILTSILLLVSSPVFANLLIEPYIGYNRGQHGGSRGQGLGYGARFGAEFTEAFLAADIGLADIQLSNSTSAKYTDIGAAFGLKSSNVRFWFGYAFSAQAVVGNSTDKGSGIKIGIGIPIASKVYFNTEVKTYDYTETTTGSTTVSNTTYGTYGMFGLSMVF